MSIKNGLYLYLLEELNKSLCLFHHIDFFERHKNLICVLLSQNFNSELLRIIANSPVKQILYLNLGILYVRPEIDQLPMRN